MTENRKKEGKKETRKGKREGWKEGTQAGKLSYSSLVLLKCLEETHEEFLKK